MKRIELPVESYKGFEVTDFHHAFLIVGDEYLFVNFSFSSVSTNYGNVREEKVRNVISYTKRSFVSGLSLDYLNDLEVFQLCIEINGETPIACQIVDEIEAKLLFRNIQGSLFPESATEIMEMMKAGSQAGKKLGS